MRGYLVTTDTPASERAFASAHEWSGDWHWLAGGADQLAAVWKAYGIAVQITPDNLVHSSVLYLIDRSGYERAAGSCSWSSAQPAAPDSLVEAGAAAWQPPLVATRGPSAG